MSENNPENGAGSHPVGMSLSLSLPSFQSSSSSDDPRRTQPKTPLNGLSVYVDVSSTLTEDSSCVRDALQPLGASVVSELQEGITHVVSNRVRSRAREGALRMKHRPLVVSPSWVFECSRQEKHVTEAPYMLYSLKEEVEMRDKASRKPPSQEVSGGFEQTQSMSSSTEGDVTSSQADVEIGHLNAAFEDVRIKPIAIRTKSVTLNELQMMPTPPELVRKRTQPRRNIAMSGLTDSAKRRVRRSIKKLGVYEYKTKVDENTKALVSDAEGTVTTNLLKALVLGVRIVGIDWVENCWNRGCWLHPSLTYCIDKWLPVSKQHKHRGMRRLFDGQQMFYVARNNSLPREALKFLIIHAGGKVTTRISDADVIVTPTMCLADVTKSRSKSKPVHLLVAQWLVDSILKGSVQPMDVYELDLTGSSSTTDTRSTDYEVSLGDHRISDVIKLMKSANPSFDHVVLGGRSNNGSDYSAGAHSGHSGDDHHSGGGSRGNSGVSGAGGAQNFVLSTRNGGRNTRSVELTGGRVSAVSGAVGTKNTGSNNQNGGRKTRSGYHGDNENTEYEYRTNGASADDDASDLLDCFDEQTGTSHGDGTGNAGFKTRAIVGNSEFGFSKDGGKITARGNGQESGSDNGRNMVKSLANNRKNRRRFKNVPAAPRSMGTMANEYSLGTGIGLATRNSAPRAHNRGGTPPSEVE